ncbi:MAG: hypothetical protein ABII12_03840 [Planctomycetota bacterium]
MDCATRAKSDSAATEARERPERHRCGTNLRRSMLGMNWGLLILIAIAVILLVIRFKSGG